MKIGVPKESKLHEYRVGLTPSSVKALSKDNEVFVQLNAGNGIGFSNRDYRSAGATIIDATEELYEKSELIVKVKEPQLKESAYLRKHHTVFSFLHLASLVGPTEQLIKSGATCIAYETVGSSTKSDYPLLSPMSEIAGRLSMQVGAHHLEKVQGGRGVLLSGIPGVAPANVVILGGGIAGTNAARMAVGMGAQITILDKHIEVLRRLEREFGSRAKLLLADEENIEQEVLQADLLIGTVLVSGASAPKLVSKSMVKKMKSGSVLIDVAIDQGGCVSTSKPTTHAKPTFIHDNVVHYCVANMPSAVARTSSIALSNATLPYIKHLAENGWVAAVKNNPYLLNGLTLCNGTITHPSTAESLNLEYISPEGFLKNPAITSIASGFG